MMPFARSTSEAAEAGEIEQMRRWPRFGVGRRLHFQFRHVRTFLGNVPLQAVVMMALLMPMRSGMALRILASEPTTSFWS
ncbi:hypothetical protein X765_32080 [Mesorhizobium sp. LSHC440B00]|nr:hypothetical protein X765_32080 [Mesorhizobium sp. LSHC440B00]ESX29135.1 hypothetical protein X764_32140 [Mesorhizobium sp. LSHC440A00]